MPLFIIYKDELPIDAITFGIKPNLPEGLSAVEVDKSDLKLPEAWYYNGHRPKYITLAGINSFTVLPGEYEVPGPEFAARTTCINNNAVLEVNKLSSKKIVVTALDGVLLPEDVDSISVAELASATDTNFSGILPILISGVFKSLTFSNGVASTNVPAEWASVTRSISIHGSTIDTPCLIDANTLRLISIRETRGELIASCDWLVSRHLSQPENAKTLTEAQYAELQGYMQALRDFPANVDLDNIVWPPKPAFML